MVLFNYAIREITAKIVYYGPGLGGKTTNLQFIHEKLDPGARGKLLSLATDGDRTLFFDFLPIEIGKIGGYKVRFQLYTVPGQVHYNATRKLVLKGVDAVAFVADSQITMLERNRESFENLAENLAENGYEMAKVPIVIQLNKRDLPNIASPDELRALMGVEGRPVFEAVAFRGDGVFETLKAIVKLTIAKLRNQFDITESAPAETKETPPPQAVFAPPPAAAVAPPEMIPVAVPEEEPTDDGSLDEFELEDFGVEPETDLAPAGDRGPETGKFLPEEPPSQPVVDLASSNEILLEEEELPATEPGLLDFDERRREYFEEVRLEEYVSMEPAAAPETTPQPEVPESPAREPEALSAAAPEPEPIVASPAVIPPAASDEPPAWAREILAELAHLRAENRGLRAVLQGMAGVFERQIAVLNAARTELMQGLGNASREGRPEDRELP